jgi:hypothetical protein
MFIGTLSFDVGVFLILFPSIPCGWFLLGGATGIIFSLIYAHRKHGDWKETV